jgi:hypothetical protein
MPRALSVSGVAGVLALALAPAVAVEVDQRTCTPPSCAVLGTPRLAADGRRVLVRSTCDLDPGRNPHGRQQLFRLDADGARQLTPRNLATRGCALDVAADATLDRVVAVVTCDPPPRSRLFESRGGRRLRPLGAWVPCDVELEPGAMSGDGEHLAVTASCRPGDGASLRHPPALLAHDAGRTGFAREPGPDCRVLFAGLDGGGGAAAFVADCDPDGANPARLFQLFHDDRRHGGRLTQLSALVPFTDCGFDEPIGSGLFARPSISADGSTVAVGASCVAPLADPVRVAARVFRWHVATGVEALTADYCVDRPDGDDGSLGLSLVQPPIGLSADGGVVAFVMACGLLDASADNDVRVFVHRDGPPASVRELVGYRKHQGVLGVSGVALTPDAATLAFVSDGAVGGCPTTGGGQVYVLRDLATPGVTATRCACGS